MTLILILLAVFVVIQLVGRSRRTRKTPEKGGKGRHFFSQVHGITHKNDDGSRRQQVIRGCRVGEELVLVPEPDNRFDPGAVKICRKNGQQLGYWKGDGRMAHDLAIGWTFRVTIDEIYPFKENRGRFGVRLRVDVLTMAHGREPN